MTIIDELKELSVYLTNLESELATFFRLSLDLLAICNPSGIMLKISPSWTEQLGYDENELLGKSTLTIIHPDDLKIAMSTLKTLETESVPKCLVRMKRKDGVYRLISWTSTRFVNNKTYSVGRDVTEVYAYHQRLEDLGHMGTNK